MEEPEDLDENELTAEMEGLSVLAKNLLKGVAIEKSNYR